MAQWNTFDFHKTKLFQLLQVVGSKLVQKEAFNDGRAIQKVQGFRIFINVKLKTIYKRNKPVSGIIYLCANIRIENQKNKNFAYAVAIAIKKINHLRDLNIILAQYL